MRSRQRRARLLAFLATLISLASVPVAFAARTAERTVSLDGDAFSGAAPIPFRAFAVRWQATPSGDADPGFAARFARGESWTEWTPLRVDPDAGGATESALVFLDEPHDAVEIAVAEPSRVAGPLSLVFIDPGQTPPVVFAPRAFDAIARPPVVSRPEWGCPEGASSPAWEPEATEPTHLVVHHTATSNGASDWPAQVRSIWTFHAVTRGWGDIGYNFLIDPLGAIYEGRAGGDDVIGAHFSCRNANTLGVALLGSFESETPSAAALASLEALLAFTAERRALDPLATTWHPGTELMLDTILGHRDGNPSLTACTDTTCPGDALYALLPGIRADVDATLDAPEPGAVAAAIAAMLALVSRAVAVRRARLSRRP